MTDMRAERNRGQMIPVEEGERVMAERAKAVWELALRYGGEDPGVEVRLENESTIEYVLSFLGGEADRQRLRAYYAESDGPKPNRERTWANRARSRLCAILEAHAITAESLGWSLSA